MAQTPAHTRSFRKKRFAAFVWRRRCDPHIESISLLIHRSPQSVPLTMDAGETPRPDAMCRHHEGGGDAMHWQRSAHTRTAPLLERFRAHDDPALRVARSSISRKLSEKRTESQTAGLMTSDGKRKSLSSGAMAFVFMKSSRIVFSSLARLTIPSQTTFFELAQGGYLARAENLILVGNPGLGKTHLAIGLALAACRQKKRVRFYKTFALINDLQVAQKKVTLSAFVSRFGKLDLLVLDELGFITVDKAEGQLLFQLVRPRYP